jgi:protein-disulfide isomerase
MTMKPIRLFYLKHCPYCRQAQAYMDELKKQDAYRHLEVEMIEESEQPELADRYDYYYVPTFYVDGEKVSEGAITPHQMEEVFKKALQRENGE